MKNKDILDTSTRQRFFKFFIFAFSNSVYADF